jgi:hypothetical protein
MWGCGGKEKKEICVEGGNQTEKTEKVAEIGATQGFAFSVFYSVFYSVFRSVFFPFCWWWGAFYGKLSAGGSCLREAVCGHAFPFPFLILKAVYLTLQGGL